VFSGGLLMLEALSAFVRSVNGACMKSATFGIGILRLSYGSHFTL